MSRGTIVSVKMWLRTQTALAVCGLVDVEGGQREVWVPLTLATLSSPRVVPGRALPEVTVYMPEWKARELRLEF